MSIGFDPCTWYGGEPALKWNARPTFVEHSCLNKVLAALCNPSLPEQFTILKTCLPYYASQLNMEREVGTCSFVSAKHDPSKLVLSFKSTDTFSSQRPHDTYHPAKNNYSY